MGWGILEVKISTNLIVGNLLRHLFIVLLGIASINADSARYVNPSPKASVHGLDIYRIHVVRNSALHYASFDGDYDLVYDLIDQGSAVHLKNALGFTPLGYAISSPSFPIPHRAIIEMLVKIGCRLTLDEIHLIQQQDPSNQLLEFYLSLIGTKQALKGLEILP
jgi:ankyrin repeat protein